MMQRDHVGVMLTPSRRTDPAVIRVLRERLTPLGAWIWDVPGENPVFRHAGAGRRDRRHRGQRLHGLRGGRHRRAGAAGGAARPSRRIELFHKGLLDDGRVRRFAGRCEIWPAAPLDDTPVAAAELRRRLRL